MFEEFKPDGSYDDTPDDIMRSKKPGASGIRDQAEMMTREKQRPRCAQRSTLVNKRGL